MASGDDIRTLEQIKARIAEINRLKREGKTLTQEELEEYQELGEKLEKIQESTDNRIKAFKEEIALLDSYLAKLEGAKNSADGMLLTREVQTEKLKQQLALEQELVKLQETITADDLNRLKALEKELRNQEDILEVQREMVDAIEQTTGLMQAAEKAGIKLGLAIQGIKAGDLSIAMGQLNVGMQKLGGYLVGNFIGGLKDMVIQFDKSSKAFETQFAVGDEYTKMLGDIIGEQAQMGVSMEELTKASGDLITSFTDFTMLAPAQRTELAKTATVMQESLGIATQDFARGIQSSTKMLGMNVESAKDFQGELAETAKALGVAPGQLSAQFAEMGPQLAKFGMQGGKTFKELARISKLTGMEMSKVLAITNKFDTFEGAAEQAGQLNAALGGNFVNAMDLMMATDPAERFQMIRDAILDTGLSFDDMSYYQKQFYTNSLGLSDVGDLALMLSGDMSQLGGATNKTAKEYEEQAERAKKLMDIQESLKSIFLELAPLVEKLAKFISMLAQGMRDYSSQILLVAKVFAGYKLLRATFAFFQKMRSVFRKADNASELAEINSITGAIKAQEKAQKKLNKAKRKGGKGGAGSMTSAFGTAASIAAIGVAILAFGKAVEFAGNGVAKMADAMKGLNAEQLDGVNSMMNKLMITMGLFSVALLALAASGSAAALPLLAFGAAVGLMGVGIGAAAAGVGYMADGISKLFTSIEVEKILPVTALITAAALGSVGLILAGAGFIAMAGGMAFLALVLKRIATRDLEAIATFTESLASIKVSQMKEIADSIKAVAKAMDDIPTSKTILFEATMRRTAETAAVIRAMQRETPAVTRTANTTTGGGAMGGARGKVAELTINMNIDGDKFASKVVNIVDEKEGMRAREAAYGQT